MQNCSPNCGKKGKTAEIFGKNTFVCQPYIKIIDPREQDLKHIFKLIDLRVMLIKTGISEEFYPGNG